MPKKIKKITTEGDNPTRITRDEVRISLNNANAHAMNYLEWYLRCAENQIKTDGNGKKITKLPPRRFASFARELVKPLMEMVDERLILKEELVVALVAGAIMVQQRES